MAEHCIAHYHRPPAGVTEEILAIVRALTGRWFTANVPDDTARDLRFQDALCVRVDGRMVAMLMFTCLDGAIHVTLMGTHPEYQGQGCGSRLVQHLCATVRALGFDRVVVMTVPPEVNPAYAATVRFYQSQGFVIRKRYTELWESGAWELVKELG
ncbi:MAG TPA: GNAT family N-acetyltransferase [Armatimonadota bacterium]|nr:GNAT family N-acetyltransferase [Armatimonadota bacterium]